VKKLFILFALLLAGPAAAQSVQQSGLVTPGHLPYWVTDGVIADGGTAQAPKVTSIGTIGPGNTICANSGPQSGPYNQICLGANPNSAATLTVTSLGGATPQSLNIVVNGTTFPIVGGVSTNAITVAARSSGASTVTASATTDYFFCLDPTANTIAVNLPATPATGLTYLVKDCTGQASIHNITIVPAAGTIDGASTSVLNTNFQSVAVTYTGAQWSVN